MHSLVQALVLSEKIRGPFWNLSALSVFEKE